MATPLWLSDNLADAIGASPDVTLFNPDGDDAPGAEIWRVADGLRDRTWWTPTTTNVVRFVRMDGVPGAPRPASMLVLDRGHNLAGRPVVLIASNDSFLTQSTVWSATIPPTPGGLPSDANGCLTPEGVWWKTFAAATWVSWALQIPAMGPGLAPLLTGVALGRAFRWPAHWDAPAAYDDRRRTTHAVNQLSRGGVRVKRSRVVHRMLAMRVSVDAEQYDAALQAEFDRVVDRGLPVWHCTDNATAAGAARLGVFQVPADVDFDPQQAPLHRELTLELEEVAPRRR